MIKLRRIVLLAAAFVLLSATPAFAQTKPGYAPGATVAVNNSSGVAGEHVVATGTCPTPNEGVSFTFNHGTAGTTQADPSGNYSFPFTVPNVSPGTYTLTATCASGATASTSFTVEGAQVVAPPPVAPGGGGLAFTGAEIGGTLGLGAVLLVAGGLLVLSTRKRRASAGA